MSPLPLITFQDLKKENLPYNGIYFFYEKGEFWGHDGNVPRIVRIGTHNDGNFHSRMMFDHYDMKEKRRTITVETIAPKDRSIFRKSLGRALLNAPPYKRDDLEKWNLDNTPKAKRKANASKRSIELEKEIENKISNLMKNGFSLRFVELESQEDRVGKKGLESKLIGTVAHCRICKASHNWLGRKSPVEKISNGKLWLVQHLNSRGMNEEEMITFTKYLQATREKWTMK